MRFAFISAMAVVPWGGSEELWSQTALRLRAGGHEVAASVCWWPQLSGKVLALREEGVDLFFRKSSSQSDYLARAWRKIKSRFQPTPMEFAWLRRFKPDLTIISQGGNTDGLAWMQFCQDAGLPYVVICQCNTEAWWPADSVAVEMAEGYPAAKMSCFVSQANRDLLERQIGRRLPNALVVSNPFNVSPAQPVPWPEDTGTWRLACVARLDPSAKGQDLLLQALAHPRWRERPMEFNLYGTGQCAEGLKQLAELLMLKPIHFHGHVDDISSIWARNHILVLPSRLEGLPLVLVESMWCGRPAIVTDIAGNAELCADGETGFVAPAPALELLERTLEVAWERRDEWKHMGEAARQRAEKLIPKDPVGLFCNQLLSIVKVKSVPPRDSADPDAATSPKTGGSADLETVVDGGGSITRQQ